MNDKSIRKILISYLQAQNREIRIYQEKSIGTSICDVMAVTDKLTGYEIKSDCDNYSRLDEQIKAYNKFFDENYIVVSDKHLKSAFSRVPGFWGIICIRENDITVERKASQNIIVSRRKQLSVLWKIELKNLLIKNNLPIYAQKEKGYIADKICETVEASELGSQIANELMHRDYSVFNATDFSLYSKQEIDFPAEEIIDTLSENSFEQITLDQWIEMYKQAKAVQETKESIYICAPVERTPHRISYKDIEVSLGAPWIDKSIIGDFLVHLLSGDEAVSENTRRYKSRVKYEEITGYWFIESKNLMGHSNINAEIKFGLPRFNAVKILEATLNLRPIKLFDNGNIYNERDTIAALEKQKLIIAEFKDWIWKDEDRRWQVEEAYNKMFARYERAAYNGEGLVFPDMADGFSLFPYQKDAVQKIMQTPNTLLAFDVGAGKTYIMIAAAMKMRRDGLSRKNMFVVPNNIVGQWEKIFSLLYPGAKILTVDPKSFKPEMRHKVLTQMKEGDYDGIIIAYSCFGMIKLSSDAVYANMDAQLKRIEDAIKNYRYYNDMRVLIKEKDRIRKLTNDFLDSMGPVQSDEITFEDLEINTLFVDEAHNYKNLPIKTAMRDLTGINTKGSAKCLDMLHKVRCVQYSNGGRGVVMATGTPLCNSISDAYAMQMYLQYEKLCEVHLDVFDNWVKTFASPEQLCEVDVDTSKYRFIRKFAKFFNLPELSEMFSEIAIFYAVNDKNALPQFDGYTDEIIPKYPGLAEYMLDLCRRTELIRGREVDRKTDNMLKVSIDGRKAALDLKLVGKEQPYNECSKIIRCTDNVISIYKENSQNTQLIFCDYSTPKGEDFSVYKKIKSCLITRGVPEKEIAFIHSYQTESKKVELYKNFNEAKVRILIGSTFKLGIGANVQRRLKAIHHLDVPWRPADMVQREGRIMRKGNENDSVLIYRYISEGSFDAYSWQLLETKQRFISQFLAGSSYQRSLADLENNVLSYAEVKALALSQPLMKQLAEKENEIKSLRIINAKEKENRQQMREEAALLAEEISRLKKRANSSYYNWCALRYVSAQEFKRVYGEIKEAFTEDIIFKKKSLPSDYSVMDFRIEFPECQDEKKPYLYLEKSEEKYPVMLGRSPAGNASRIINVLKGFDKISNADAGNYKNALKRREDIEKLLSLEESEYQRKLSELEREAAEIKQIIEMSSDKPAV